MAVSYDLSANHSKHSKLTKGGWTISSDPAGYPPGFASNGTIIGTSRQRNPVKKVGDVVVMPDSTKGGMKRLGISFSPTEVTSEMTKAAYSRAEKDLGVTAREDPTRSSEIAELAYHYIGKMLEAKKGKHMASKEASDTATTTVRRKKKKKTGLDTQQPAFDAPAQSLGQSSDVALGAVLAQFQQQLSQIQQKILSDERSERIRTKKRKRAKMEQRRREREEEEVAQVLVEEKEEPVQDMVPKAHVAKLVEQILASMQIPGLQPQAAKPKHRVTFTIPNAGNVTAYYHWVLLENSGVFLVYDTRFEHGMLYEPPDLGRVCIQLKIQAGVEKEAYVCTCFSSGVSVQFGCFRIIWLVETEQTKAAVSADPDGYGNIGLDSMLQQVPGAEDGGRHLIS